MFYDVIDYIYIEKCMINKTKHISSFVVNVEVYQKRSTQEYRHQNYITTRNNDSLIGVVVERNIRGQCSKAAFTQNNILFFCVNRGDELLCFYTNVAFENIGFRALFPSFFVCMKAA